MSVTVARIADTVRCRQLTPPFVAGSLLPPHSDVVAHCRVHNAGHVRGLPPFQSTQANPDSNDPASAYLPARELALLQRPIQLIVRELDPGLIK